MEYKNLVKDFADRTRRNLSLIQNEAKAGRDAYEVTQLINSMLGLLVFPQQEFFDKIPKIKIDDLKKDGWPIPCVRGNYPQVSDLKQLARYLRNGIAHFNLRFTDTNGHVDGLIIWNEYQNGKKNWEAELRIDELEGIIDRFTKLLLR
ncbi:MAG: hypothetical protein LLG04_01335 [Parachlamydia sp.]|nr:hypothetical protein [Parachlamydia sp.]